jgi:S-formylglutathione hydrolase FrmB
MTPIVPVLAATVALHGFASVTSGPAGGTLLSGTFPGTQRPGYVYLPPRFEPKQRYPVVYLLHGLRGSPSEFVAAARLVSFADGGISAGTMRPFIAVIPAAGATHAYNGEWAGPWENALVQDVVPWVDANLPTVRGPTGRVLAGLSAGGFGAVDIGLRHPGLFGTVESWGGYFHPLPDGPFAHASRADLRAHDPTLLVRSEASLLRRAGTAFFVSSGPSHSHRFTAAGTFAFARELRGLGLPVVSFSYPQARGQWRAQFDQGLAWAFRVPGARATSGSGATSAVP